MQPPFAREFPLGLQKGIELHVGVPSGTYFIDPVLANASKIHEGKEMSEATRLMIDIAGGFVADLPSDRDFDNPEVGPLLKKYLKGNGQTPVENRVKMFRLIEKLAMESADTISDIHGGGSPAAPGSPREKRG